MRVLRLDERGPEVRRWQFFLWGQGFDPGPADGIFGERTAEATKGFQQRHGLVIDGIAANRTFGQAMLLGFEGVRDIDQSRQSGNWPDPPRFRPLVGTAARQRRFGTFRFRHHPIPGNPENVRVLDGWAEESIGVVQLPITTLRNAPRNGHVQFYKRAIPQLEAMWTEWEDNNLLGCLVTWDGFVTWTELGANRGQAESG